MHSRWISILALSFASACGTAALASAATAQTAPTAEPAQGETVRSRTPLAQGWQFQFAGEAPGDTPPVSGEWTPVSVPHTWNRVGLYDKGVLSQDTQTEDNRVGTGWYKLALPTPAGTAGKRVWLEFDGASRYAEVWLNGTRLGDHAGGFSTFRFDATDALNTTGTNELRVKVDNTATSADHPENASFPLMGDFFVHGGLYRPVELIVTEPVHFALDDHGGSGVYASTTQVTGGTASIDVTMRLSNQSGKDTKGKVLLRLVDREGKVAAQAERPIALLAKADGTEQQLSLSVPDVHLWQGTRDPYLYNLVADVFDARGRLLDRVSQNFGIRTIALDADKGFLLNGQIVDLRGVGLHQDLGGKGWALSVSDVTGMFDTIREMGANTIRLTHYQHGQTIHDLADRYGLIVWDEIPLVSAWTLTDAQEETPADLLANARQQLQELIRQNYNHPSVAVWGIANEVDFGPNRPDFIGTPPTSIPDPRPLLENLNALAKQEDPVRPTVLANCCEGTPMRDTPDVSGITDAVGVNRYLGWYYGSAAMLSKALDALHAKHPDEPLAVSEYGAGGAFSVDSDDPLGGKINPGGRAQPESYQAWLHEQLWPVIEAKPYLWASWLWNSFDFSTVARREGDSRNINTKGLVSYDGKIRKDAWWYYKANWSNAPVVHVTASRYTDRAYAVSDVKVYSNAASTQLYLNGQPLGARSACDHAVCVWPSVRLAPGSNTLEAKAMFADGEHASSVTWSLAREARNTFNIDAGAIVAATSETGRFGSDAFFEGGEPATMDTHEGLRGPPIRAEIAGSPDRDLIATMREGKFAYHVPVEPGRYEVTLRFAEPGADVGARVFDVAVNGKTALKAFDIRKAAGAALTTIARTIPVTVTRGTLDIAFAPIKGKAIVSALEIAPVK